MALAHQGGWDEALVVLAPLLLIAAVLWLANRRAGRRRAAGEGAADTAGTRSTPPGGHQPDR